MLHSVCDSATMTSRAHQWELRELRWAQWVTCALAVNNFDRCFRNKDKLWCLQALWFLKKFANAHCSYYSKLDLKKLLRISSHVYRTITLFIVAGVICHVCWNPEFWRILMSLRIYLMSFLWKNSKTNEPEIIGNNYSHCFVNLLLRN